MREALAIRRRALGNEHPGVAQSLNNIAGLLKAQVGIPINFSASIPTYREKLHIDREN